MKVQKILQAVVLLLMMSGLQGCLVGAVVDVAATTVKAGVGVTGAVAGGVVDVVVPDRGDNDD